MSEVPVTKSGMENADPWEALKSYTNARIGLGRTGNSVPLTASFAFKLAHAHARDAVYAVLDFPKLIPALEQLPHPVIQVQSKVNTKQEYLLRPDWGRKLNDPSAAFLAQYSPVGIDIAIILGDGLSATAINEHAVPLLQLLLPEFKNRGFRVAPIVVAGGARVALADEIGELLQAQLTLILIGERPGLSSPDSMGAYLTYAPKIGLTDESRNCVSNIRPEGLPYKAAEDKILFLVQEALRRKLSGVRLKEETELLDG